jgi:glycosyltransferase involved in cell wall biosynthesis
MTPLAPTVGVVLTNHNNCAYVEKAIESAARQTVRDIRVMVIDDASTDGSQETIRRCLSRLDDRRFRYIGLDVNVGQSGALRRGLLELDTPLVCFLDSDDIWYEAFIARHIEAHMNADFPVALSYCDSHIIDANDRLLAGKAWWFGSESAEPRTGPVNPLRLPNLDPQSGQLSFPRNPEMSFQPQWSAGSGTNSTASMMLRRSFVDLVFVRPDNELRLYVDFYLSSCACLLTGAIAIHEALYAYRMHGRNKHSNAMVMGGAYNSSTRPWETVHLAVLKMVYATLESEGPAIQSAFGHDRHMSAMAKVAEAIGLRDQPKSSGRMLDTLLGRIASSFSNGRRPSGRPHPSRSP